MLTECLLCMRLLRSLIPCSGPIAEFCHYPHLIELWQRETQEVPRGHRSGEWQGWDLMPESAASTPTANCLMALH